MKSNASILRALSLGAGLLALAASAFAQSQIIDLRLPAQAFPQDTVIDPNTGVLFTRPCPDAMQGVEASFFAISQQPGGTGPGQTALEIRTYSTTTVLTRLSRYEIKPSDSSAPRAGAAQWSFDLSSLDGGLKSSSQSVEKLELRLVLGGHAEFKFDAYLSPGRVGPKVKPVDIASYTAEDCYNLLWLPARGHKPGDIVAVEPDVNAKGAAAERRSFRVAQPAVHPTGELSIDLTEDYRAGTRKFSLILVAGAFGKHHQITIKEGSGLYLTTKR